MTIDALDVIHDAELRSPPMNMAVDEALLQTAIVPALRFYQWHGPAVSFGYFSRIAEVRELAGSRELVRRWTGGGIVMHGHDLTYAFVIPAGHELHRTSAREIYAFVHRTISSVFARNGVAAMLAATATPRVSDACFANPVRADVLVGGRKIVGAAQRRTRAGLLQQGSIQVQELPHQFTRDVSLALCDTAREVSVGAECLAAAQELATRKYGTAEWLTRC